MSWTVIPRWLLSVTYFHNRVGADAGTERDFDRLQLNADSATSPGGHFVRLLGLLLCAQANADAYRFDVVYTGEVLSNVSGGVDTGNRYLDNRDLMLEVDLTKALGVGSGTVFLYGLYNNGSTFADELVGDLQVTSNIDAPEAWRIFEAWYEYVDGPWSIRMGLYDLNSEFDVNETGDLFLGSSHGIGAAFGQTGRMVPAFFRSRR